MISEHACDRDGGGERALLAREQVVPAPAGRLERCVADVIAHSYDDEQIAAADERAAGGTCVERLVAAGERLWPAGAERQQAQRQEQLVALAGGGDPPISRRSIAWR